MFKTVKDHDLMFLEQKINIRMISEESRDTDD